MSSSADDDGTRIAGALDVRIRRWYQGTGCWLYDYTAGTWPYLSVQPQFEYNPREASPVDPPTRSGFVGRLHVNAGDTRVVTPVMPTLDACKVATLIAASNELVEGT